MREFVRDQLEDCLSGALPSQEQAKLEAFLKENPAEAKELALFEESDQLLKALRLPQDEILEPEPTFYARLMQQIESEREIPFWEVFLQPAFGRRLAFGSLMWLALLGGYVATFGGPAADATQHIAERLFTEPPSADYELRLSADLQRNRGSMLVGMMSEK